MTTASPSSPVFVSGAAAEAVFQWKDAVSALQAAYAQPFDAASTPPRTVATEGGASLRTLPAIPAGARYFGAKVMGMTMAGATPGCEYVIVLFDRETGQITAFVDGNLVTGLRTAATSAAALDRLVPERPARLAVLGSGLEAAMHTRAFAAVRSLTEVMVFSPSPERRQDFARQISEELGVPVRAVDGPEEAVEGADIVLAAARSRGEKPILFGDWLRPGMAVVSIGSTVPHQREIDFSVVERADLIVCDVLEEVLEETGDMLAAEEAGIAFRDKSFSMNALLAGDLDDRLRSASLPMFKSVGSGVQDVLVAQVILTKALESGQVTSLPIEFDTKRPHRSR
ncbi:ornithine cyclodeaminase family protein [Streptomyces sp. NPDC091280]|uniref:ornithine cyclodeaminase family protein n=1 Tax=Streptomyces sp. NPDC091280 TaxID=3365984 RepID=UPI0037F1D66E